ncbi:hypothetical protein J1N35_019646 [Gossypium stocksii]|uniref:Transposase MuDR plant domain-containing protein n=1 Tax=Gossypium stocksii TaxID=47602 RepID=A0A9D3VRM8_9ROSI|nr:hypothetical protein J1N35_019646 [Gossypium stocksii]
MKVLSIKYRFCASDDPVTYDSFDINGARGLEAMVQTHLASGAPYLELYVQFSSPNDVFAPSTSTAIPEEYTTAIPEDGWQNTEAPVFGSSTEYTTPTRHSVSRWDIHLSESISDAGNTYWGTSTSTDWQATSNWGHYETFRRRDDILSMTSIGEGTSYVAADGRSDDESDVDSPREFGPDGAEVALFSEPEPVPTEAEGGSDEEEEDPRFRANSPSTHIHNIDISNDDALEFSDLPHRRRDRASSSLDSGKLEVGKGFSNKDSFLSALKQRSIMNGVNYNVVKSKSDKFEAKYAMKDGTCAWKIMASLRKMIGLWEIKKYKGPHTCVGGVSQDHPKMDSSMCASLILSMLKKDPRTSVPALIFHIRSQFRILSAIEREESLWQRTHHRYCLKHVASNYYMQYRSTTERRQVTNMGYEISKDRFHEMLALWRSINEEGVDYLCNIPFEQWTQAYDGGLRYGHMTTNLAECINSIIKGTRHLPITLVARETYFQLAALFLKQAVTYKGQMQGGHVWCHKVLQAINKSKARANIMYTVCHNRDDVYKIKYMYNIWRHVFPLVLDERKWPSISLALFKLLSNRELRRKPKGRPCSSRIRNNMDIRETTNQQKLCGWCRNPGHTSRSCPNRNG